MMKLPASAHMALSIGHDKPKVDISEYDTADGETNYLFHVDNYFIGLNISGSMENLESLVSQMSELLEQKKLIKKAAS